MLSCAVVVEDEELPAGRMDGLLGCQMVLCQSFLEYQSLSFGNGKDSNIRG